MPASPRLRPAAADHGGGRAFPPQPRPANGGGAFARDLADCAGIRLLPRLLRMGRRADGGGRAGPSRLPRRRALPRSIRAGRHVGAAVEPGRRLATGIVTTAAEQPPAWLVAWRERRGLPPAPAQPAPRPRPADKPRTAPPRRTDPQGFSEPAPWAWDGGLRREPVLDLDHTPPPIVRRVGWLRCLRCRKPFFSDDVTGLHLCGERTDGCRGDDERFAG